MTDIVLDNIARNIITAFLLPFDLAPSEGDSTEIREDDPYRIYTTQVKIPPGTVIDIDKMYQEFAAYLQQSNALATVVVKFYPLRISTYSCPCGCGDYIYLDFYTVL